MTDLHGTCCTAQCSDLCGRLSASLRCKIESRHDCNDTSPWYARLHATPSTISAVRPGRVLGVGAAVLAAVALTNHALARRAEHRYPPGGKFITVDRVRLHYIERGAGPVIVLLHGNGTMARYFVLSGVLDLLAKDHRVIAFDRPGFGFSERPRGRIWTAEAQAALLHKALLGIEVTQAVVVGHSWGTLVALALALREPADVAGLVLLSGYYFPSVHHLIVLPKILESLLHEKMRDQARNLAFRFVRYSGDIERGRLDLIAFATATQCE